MQNASAGTGIEKQVPDAVSTRQANPCSPMVPLGRATLFSHNTVKRTFMFLSPLCAPAELQKLPQPTLAAPLRQFLSPCIPSPAR
jgi:hypothetical protein